LLELIQEGLCADIIIAVHTICNGLSAHQGCYLLSATKKSSSNPPVAFTVDKSSSSSTSEDDGDSDGDKSGGAAINGEVGGAGAWT
jgi:hypothetical protein